MRGSTPWSSNNARRARTVTRNLCAMPTSRTTHGGSSSPRRYWTKSQAGATSERPTALWVRETELRPRGRPDAEDRVCTIGPQKTERPVQPEHPAAAARSTSGCVPRSWKGASSKHQAFGGVRNVQVPDRGFAYSGGGQGRPVGGRDGPQGGGNEGGRERRRTPREFLLRAIGMSTWSRTSPTTRARRQWQLPWTHPARWPRELSCC